MRCFSDRSLALFRTSRQLVYDVAGIYPMSSHTWEPPDPERSVSNRHRQRHLIWILSRVYTLVPIDSMHAFQTFAWLRNPEPNSRHLMKIPRSLSQSINNAWLRFCFIISASSHDPNGYIMLLVAVPLDDISVTRSIPFIIRSDWWRDGSSISNYIYRRDTHMENWSGLSARLLTNSIVTNTPRLALPGTIIPDLILHQVWTRHRTTV
jgi:hypothetical protein